jgi:hypothetical protein
MYLSRTASRKACLRISCMRLTLEVANPSASFLLYNLLASSPVSVPSYFAPMAGLMWLRTRNPRGSSKSYD